MNIELLKQLANLSNQFKELNKQFREEGPYAIRIDGEVHVTLTDLVGKENLVSINRGSEEYPYEIYYFEEGIKIFAIARTEQLKDFPQFKEFHRNFLLKQLADLEKEEEVTA